MVRKNKSQTLIVRLNSELFAALDAAIKTNDLNRTDIITAALEAYLYSPMKDATPSREPFIADYATKLLVKEISYAKLFAEYNLLFEKAMDEYGHPIILFSLPFINGVFKGRFAVRDINQLHAIFDNIDDETAFSIAEQFAGITDVADANFEYGREFNYISSLFLSRIPSAPTTTPQEDFF